MIRTCLLALALLLPAAAHAQDDDLLAPLAPKPTQAKKHHHRKSHRKSQPAPAPTPAPQQNPAPADDLSVLAPLQLPTALGVRVGEGLSRAEVFVDGMSWGFAPIAPKEISPGPHRVVVKRPGFAEFSKTVQLRPGKKLQLSAELEPVSGVLAVKTTPEGADVLIDGKTVGRTPVADLLLPPGSYELRVRHLGFMDDVSRIAVRAGRDYPIDLALVAQPHENDRPTQVALAPTSTPSTALPGTPVAEAEAEAPKPWYNHWYVWAGVGVVAAAAVGIAAASGGGGSPISAQSVCGGSCDAVLNAP